jgi:DNA-directed RNA polymerase specialized sigma24 family protein
MIHFSNIRVRKNEVNPYATREDFCRVFSEEKNELYQLSFLLTRDHKKAEQCLVSGLEDCVKGNPVFREWARSWAKRTIIQNAIRELKPRPGSSNSSPPATISSHIDQMLNGPAGHFEIDAVLALEDFKRFVFVMSVLEHYSQHDCALLLECSLLEIREALPRAFEELAHSTHMIFPHDEVFMQETK